MNKQKFYVLVVFALVFVFASSVFAASTATSSPVDLIKNQTINFVAKFTSNGGSLVNSSIFDNGMVGIGTVTPNAKLEISNGILKSSFQKALRFSGMYSGETAQGQDIEWVASNAYNVATIRGGVNEHGDEPFLGFLTNSYATENYLTERMRITNFGDVGIGTTSPTQRLEVNGGVRLNTTDAKPDCNASNRGTFWTTFGGSGVADNTEICRKNVSDSYVWVSVY